MSFERTNVSQVDAGFRPPTPDKVQKSWFFTFVHRRFLFVDIYLSHKTNERLHPLTNHATVDRSHHQVDPLEFVVGYFIIDKCKTNLSYFVSPKKPEYQFWGWSPDRQTDRPRSL